MRKNKRYDLLILDVDGTMYDINDVIRMTYLMQVDFYARRFDKTKEQVEKIFEENNIRPFVTEKTRSATEFFIKNGVDREEWSEFRRKNFVLSNIDKNKAVSHHDLVRLSNYYPIILLSTNTKDSILKVLNWIGVDEKIFLGIISCDNPSITPFDKKNAIEYISTMYECEPSKMLSIGDRYQTDIVPMIELGGDGVVVNGPQGTSLLLRHLLSEEIKSCAEYTLYQKER